MRAFTAHHYAIYDAKFTNWASEVHDKWVYDDFKADPLYSKQWISLTSIGYHEPSDTVFVGIGSFSRELLWKFDRRNKSFESCGYEKVAGPFDAKFHRSLEIDGDTLYAGTALFHDIDKQFEAHGGTLVSYDINKGEFTKLCVPVERVYIQSIALDRKNRVIYGFGAAPEVFWSYDLKTSECRFIAYIGSGAEFAESHCPVIDDDGCVWGTYGILRAFAYDTGPDSIRIFKYDPKTERMEFFRHGFVKTSYADKAKPDIALNIGDGYLYYGTEAGTLQRLDPGTGEAVLLCRPSTKGSTRLAALAQNPRDGLLYGVTGSHYDTELFCYDPKAEKLVGTAPIVDKASGDRPDKIHHMVFTPDGTIYGGENDNNDRSGYLWELEFEY